jgi:hypothetical protein
MQKYTFNIDNGDWFYQRRSDVISGDKSKKVKLSP